MNRVLLCIIAIVIFLIARAILKKYLIMLKQQNKLTAKKYFFLGLKLSICCSVGVIAVVFQDPTFKKLRRIVSEKSIYYLGDQLSQIGDFQIVLVIISITWIAIWLYIGYYTPNHIVALVNGITFAIVMFIYDIINYLVELIPPYWPIESINPEDIQNVLDEMSLALNGRTVKEILQIYIDSLYISLSFISLAGTVYGTIRSYLSHKKKNHKDS
jgi:hypothetical protein